MKKSELVDALAGAADLTKAQAEATIDALPGIVLGALNDGGSIVLPGIAKIEERGFFRWISELKNFGIYIDRNGHQQYLAGGSLEDYERSQVLAEWVNRHPVLITLLVAPGLIVELVAPLALLNRTMAFLMGVGMIGLHILVGYLMQLSFPMNELIILIFVINVPFFLSWLITKAGSTIGVIKSPVKAN